MLKFLRITHDDNRNPLPICYDKTAKKWSDKCVSIGVHGLDSGKPLTLLEYITECRTYHTQYNEPQPSIEEIMQDLVYLIKGKLVKIVQA